MVYKVDISCVELGFFPRSDSEVLNWNKVRFWMPKITPALFYTINFWIQTRISNRIYYFSTWPIELNYFRKQRTWIIQIESMGQCDTQRSHLINLTAPFIWCHLAWLVWNFFFVWKMFASFFSSYFLLFYTHSMYLHFAEISCHEVLVLWLGGP